MTPVVRSSPPCVSTGRPESRRNDAVTHHLWRSFDHSYVTHDHVYVTRDHVYVTRDHVYVTRDHVYVVRDHVRESTAGPQHRPRARTRQRKLRERIRRPLHRA